jgi:hypothetical protein
LWLILTIVKVGCFPPVHTLHHNKHLSFLFFFFYLSLNFQKLQSFCFRVFLLACWILIYQCSFTVKILFFFSSSKTLVRVYPIHNLWFLFDKKLSLCAWYITIEEYLRNLIGSIATLRCLMAFEWWHTTPLFCNGKNSIKQTN